MKIGINALGFNAEEHMDAVLAPWLALKEEAKKYALEPKDKQTAPEDKIEIFISAAYGIFPEVDQVVKNARPEAKVPVDNTEFKLREYHQKGLIDSLFIANEPMYEKDLRNSSLSYLLNDADVDLIWLLDLQDEIYTKEQILNIIKFIKEDKEHFWWKIAFKNYFRDEKTWYDGFAPSRIWRTREPAVFGGYFYDNDVVYRNGLRQDEVANATIPKEIAHVKHLSWCGSKSRLKSKVLFQMRHYPMTSFAWDNQADQLIFNEQYYKNLNQSIPELFFE